MKAAPIKPIPRVADRLRESRDHLAQVPAPDETAVSPVPRLLLVDPVGEPPVQPVEPVTRPEPTPAAPVAEPKSVTAPVARQSTPRKTSSTSSSAKPKSAESDGGSTRTTFTVPPGCIERLRDLAYDRRMKQADALIVELDRLARQADPDLFADTTAGKTVEGLGEFLVDSRSRAAEPHQLLGLRLSRHNLAVMDDLVVRLGAPSRSALVAKALS
jgi:hypothetical protein